MPRLTGGCTRGISANVKGDDVQRSIAAKKHLRCAKAFLRP